MALEELVGHKATDHCNDQAHQARPQQNALGEVPALQPEVAAIDRAEGVCSIAWSEQLSSHRVVEPIQRDVGKWIAHQRPGCGQQMVTS